MAKTQAEIVVVHLQAKDTRIASHHGNEERGNILRILNRNQPFQHLDFRLLASRTLREYICFFVCFFFQGHTHSIWIVQPQPRQILNPLNKVRDQTRIFMGLTRWATTGIPHFCHFKPLPSVWNIVMATWGNEYTLLKGTGMNFWFSSWVSGTSSTHMLAGPRTRVRYVKCTDPAVPWGSHA